MRKGVLAAVCACEGQRAVAEREQDKSKKWLHFAGWVVE